MFLKYIPMMLVCIITSIYGAGGEHPANNIPLEQRLYVVHSGRNNVSIINTEDNAVVGDPIGVGNEPISGVIWKSSRPRIKSALSVL